MEFIEERDAPSPESDDSDDLPPPPPPAARGASFPPKAAAAAAVPTRTPSYAVYGTLDGGARQRAVAAFITDPTMFNALYEMRTRFDVAAVPNTGRDDDALLARLEQAGASRDRFERMRDLDVAHAALRDAEDPGYQQLRAMFAAADRDEDGLISPRELSDVIVSLGIVPEPKVLKKFTLMSAHTPNVDLPTFLYVAANKLFSVSCSFTEGDITDLFAQSSGCPAKTISSKALMRLLQSTELGGAALSDDEVGHFMKYLRCRAPQMTERAVVDELMGFLSLSQGSS